MDPGMNPTGSSLRRVWLLALLSMAVALPAASMNKRSIINSGATLDPPAPSTGQRALIEAHDTASVGWWSSPAMDIAPWPDATEPSATPQSDALPDPLAPAPASAYPRRTPGIESR
jgi:hypothetical protein